MSNIAEDVICPICYKEFTSSEIEDHANRCLFLNSPSSSKSTKHTKRSSIENSNDVSAMPVKKHKPSSPENLNASIDNDVASVSKEAAYSNGQTVSLDSSVPLAEQMRPCDLNDFVGQDNILGQSTMLRTLLEKGDITSMILWGPPGCGKTTLAHIIANNCRRGKTAARFVKTSAVTSGVADVKEIVKVAKNELNSFKRRTVLFMDEIHRFNKMQQDVFLPHIESGCITLIGATTENPSFSLNTALLSRCRVFVLEKLSAQHISTILLKSVGQLDAKVVVDSDELEEEDRSNEMMIEEGALQWLADVCDGDARIALNSLQLAFQTCKQRSANGETGVVTLDDIQDSIKRSHLLYDRAGEEHYNLISAMHKSIRASDQNAALYWLARMLQGGEDPRFIARRLVRAASEDIGLADSTALTLAVSTMQGCQLLGMPEADVLLAQCAVYLARLWKRLQYESY
ncbi:hypothetical protein B566_EDAN007621 [Ephemera danica]|nr:hypothetical protein B566_EDAN007621 [Ephemera danica]